MAHDSFDQMDESLMKGLQPLRERRVPENALRGFGASVEKRILETQSQVPFFKNGAVVLSAAFFLLVALGVAWQWLKSSPPPMPVQAKMAVHAQKMTLPRESDIESDIEALKALGVQPGPHFGEILRQLKCAYLDGHITNAAEEKALLHKLINSDATL